MLSKMHNRQKGFTLIELLIVVAIIGIIAAILIPNFLDALHKGRQKRTMGDIKEFANGLGAYYVDFGGAAAAGQATDVVVGDYPGFGAAKATNDQIQAALVPEYVPLLPETDAWGNTMEYALTLIDPPRTKYALVRAQALGGAWDGDTYTPGAFEPTDYEKDVVWADGGFVRAPKGSRSAAGGT